MQTNKTGGGDKPTTAIPVIFPLASQQLNQYIGKHTSPYHTLQTNIAGHTGSVHTKAHLVTTKHPGISIPHHLSVSAVEAHMCAPDNGGRQT